jgi:Surface antigen variable number repeat
LQQDFLLAYIRPVGPRGVLPIVALAVVGTLSCGSGTRAQLPERVERCLPHPTYQQEVEGLFSKPELNKASTERMVVIDSVEFDGPITLPMQNQQKLIDELRNLDKLDANSHWLKEVEEGPIRGAWQDDGYFKVEVAATAKQLGGDALHEHWAVRVHVDEGLRYFQGPVQFTSSEPDDPLVFSPGELRNLYPLREGDVLNADEIRKSLDAYRQLYAAHGYIDFSAVPEFDVHDDTQRVELTIELDQQKQFRIDRVEVDGLDPRTEGILRSMIKPGDVFNYDLVKGFFEENKSELPTGASLDDLRIQKNVKEGTTSLGFDFFTCPKSGNQAEIIR